MSLPDIRWKRPDIKTIGLLPNVLARQAAKEKGAQEAWLIDAEGMVTEGAASNAWIIDQANTIITRQIDNGILSGVTRATLLDLIGAEGLTDRRKTFQPRRGESRPRGLRDRRDEPGDACCCHRRDAGRRRPARPIGPKIAWFIS